MDPKDTIRLLGGEIAPGVQIRGHWFNIRVCPARASGEILNIGVGFIDDQGRLFTRLASDFGRLTCLFDDRVDTESFNRMASLIQAEFNGSAATPSKLLEVVPELLVSELKAASGSSVEKILANLFAATVTIGQPRVDRTMRERGITTEQLRDEVVGALRKRHGAKIEGYIPRRPVIVVDGKSRKVALTFRKEGRLAASLISIWHREHDRRKASLLEAALDLDVVQRHSSRNERLGLFVVRPMSTSEAFTQSELGQIDTEVDDVAWRLRDLAPKRAVVEAASSPHEIASQVESWLGMAA